MTEEAFGKAFFEKAVSKEGRTSYSCKDLECLAEIDINGCQVGFPAECSQRLVY